jgi:hypothetical protein
MKDSSGPNLSSSIESFIANRRFVEALYFGAMQESQGQGQEPQRHLYLGLACCASIKPLANNQRDLRKARLYNDALSDSLVINSGTSLVYEGLYHLAFSAFLNKYTLAFPENLRPVVSETIDDLEWYTKEEFHGFSTPIPGTSKKVFAQIAIMLLKRGLEEKPQRAASDPTEDTIALIKDFLDLAHKHRQSESHVKLQYYVKYSRFVEALYFGAAKLTIETGVERNLCLGIACCGAIKPLADYQRKLSKGEFFSLSPSDKLIVPKESLLVYYGVLHLYDAYMSTLESFAQESFLNDLQKVMAATHNDLEWYMQNDLHNALSANPKFSLHTAAAAALHLLSQFMQRNFTSKEVKNPELPLLEQDNAAELLVSLKRESPFSTAFSA